MKRVISNYGLQLLNYAHNALQFALKEHKEFF